MLPKFLRPEVLPYVSVTVIPAPPELDPEDDADDARIGDEIPGSTCGTACGYCGRCS